MHDKYVLAAARWVVKRRIIRRGQKLSQYLAKEITELTKDWLETPSGIKFAELMCDLSN